jgi:hypothetical protein
VFSPREEPASPTRWQNFPERHGSDRVLAGASPQGPAQRFPEVKGGGSTDDKRTKSRFDYRWMKSALNPLVTGGGCSDRKRAG